MCWHEVISLLSLHFRLGKKGRPQTKKTYEGVFFFFFFLSTAKGCLAVDHRGAVCFALLGPVYSREQAEVCSLLTSRMSVQALRHHNKVLDPPGA